MGAAVCGSREQREWQQDRDQEQREWQQDHDQKQKYTKQEDTEERPPTEEEITQALETLEIRKTKEVVTSNEVSKAYRTKALLYHPDKNNGNPEAVEKMKKVNAANEILNRYIRLRDK
ncbi:hypothetical protein AGMMS49936_06860 [Endomicrobiia bacterium]|nr:hypothetical protein AGMMS49936_06860 [Endomicrobiia bacterium]